MAAAAPAIHLKTRISLLVAALVVAGIWGLALRVSAVLQADLERLLAEQLASTIRYIASDLDNKIELRFSLLEGIAAAITPQMLADPARLQRFVEQRGIPPELFPTGVIVLDTKGTGLADFPRLPGRVGGSLADRDWFREIMAGRPRAIGALLVARFAKYPLVPVAVPVRDAGGALAAVLVSSFHPSDTHLFGLLDETEIGKGATILVASPRDRLWVSTNDKSRFMKPMPVRGVNPTLDRRIDEGFEGAAVVTQTQGEGRGTPMLGVSRTMKTTGWVAIASVPLSEALAPVRDLTTQIYLAALLLSLVLALVLRLVLARQLAPLEGASAAMRRMSAGEQSFAPLPTGKGRQDEIGQMVDDFNHLVTERNAAEQDLRESEERFRMITETILPDDFVWVADEKFKALAYASPGFERVWKRPLQSLRDNPRSFIDAIHPDDRRKFLADHEVRHAGQPFSHEYRISWPDGTSRRIRGRGYPVKNAEGRVLCYVGIAQDITDSRLAERVLMLEHEVNRSLAVAGSASAGIIALLRLLCEIEDWQCGRYFRLDEEAGLLRFAEFWHKPGEINERFVAMSRDKSFKLGAGIAGEAWQTGNPVWVPDVTVDGRALYPPPDSETRAYGAFAFPVMSSGKTLGVISVTSHEVRKPDDRLLQAIGIITNQLGQFLERRRAEDEQRRFRAAVDVSADLVLLIDPERIKYVDANVTACNRLGYSREELLAMGPHELFSSTREQLAESYRRMLAGDLGEANVNGWFRCKDGSRFPVESMRRVVASAGGHVIVAVTRDISERKRAEQLRDLEHTVTRSLAAADGIEEALLAVIRTVCEAEDWQCGRYFTVDAGGGAMRLETAWGVPAEGVQRYLAASRSIVYLPGVGLAGRAWQTQAAQWSSDITADSRVSQAALAVDTGMRGAFVFPVLADGAALGVLAFNSIAVREPDPHMLQAISVIGSQIGQFLRRKREEGRVRQLNVELEQRVLERTVQLEATVRELKIAVDEMESFTYTVAHDLRAPLRAMNSFSQILIEDYAAQIPEEGRHYLRRVAGNAQGMARLIDDLLVFSRYGRQPLNKQDVDPAPIIRAVLAEALPAGGRVEVLIGALPRCMADPALLRVALGNLISNAVKYSAKVDAPRIEIGHDGGAYFVRDNGVGFDMAHTANLFGVFQRLHRKEDFEGTGVGLAIVKRIVERHGGRVWAQSEPGKGASFYFTLA